MSDLKIASTEYVDSRQGLKGEYTYEPYYTVFKVGPESIKLNVGTGLSVGNGGTSSDLYGNELSLSTSDGPVKSNIELYTSVDAFSPNTSLRISATSYEGVEGKGNFKIKNGEDTVLSIYSENNEDHIHVISSIYVDGPVKCGPLKVEGEAQLDRARFTGMIIDKNGMEVLGGGGGTTYQRIKEDTNSVFINGPLNIDNSLIISNRGINKSIFLEDSGGTTLSFGNDKHASVNNPASVFVVGPLYIFDNQYNKSIIKPISTNDRYFTGIKIGYADWNGEISTNEGVNITSKNISESYFYSGFSTFTNGPEIRSVDSNTLLIGTDGGLSVEVGGSYIAINSGKSASPSRVEFTFDDLIKLKNLIQ